MSIKVFVLKDEDKILRPQAFLAVDNNYIQENIDDYKSRNKKMFQNGCEIVLCELKEIN